MDATPKQVLFPASFQELFALWNRFPSAEPYAGGTGFGRSLDQRLMVLPTDTISLEKIEELKRITRTERYIEIGAMVKLNEIINLGKIVPEILIRTLEGIAGVHVRNSATIGGNLCEKTRRLDAAAAMAALDAHFELRSAASARWISASRFSATNPPALAHQELLTRIRIPLEQWNYSLYQKFKSAGSNESGEVIIFIMKNQKSTLTDLRVVYSGNLLLQNREIEAPLIGKRLPLDRKEALSFLDNWKHFLESLETDASLKVISIMNTERKKNDLLKVQILNFLENALLDITD
ncbi:MAG: FAD binding domain-containing protein [Treponema sp.]|jgi:CO/xanthine dehydrogenase FAD-binding subunit|nr:FAD binding domain-containing protein [Treponema sp.]